MESDRLLKLFRDSVLLFRVDLAKGLVSSMLSLILLNKHYKLSYKCLLPSLNSWHAVTWLFLFLTAVWRIARPQSCETGSPPQTWSRCWSWSCQKLYSHWVRSSRHWISLRVSPPLLLTSHSSQNLPLSSPLHSLPLYGYFSQPPAPSVSDTWHGLAS